MQTPTTNPAERVVAAFGGYQAVSDILGIGPIQVRRWAYPESRGGHAGNVPPRHHKRLLDEAAARGIDLKPGDLMPWLAEPASHPDEAA